MRLAVGAAVLAACGRYAYLRLTVMPPRSADNYYEGLCPDRTPSADDVTAELLPIMLTLGQSVSFNYPPPPNGMTWQWPRGGSVPASGTLDVTDSLNGGWEPAARPNLQTVIAHLESGLIRADLDKLRAYRGHPWYYCTEAEFAKQPGAVTLSGVRAAVKMLATDARYQHAERRDATAAWEDLKTGLWLADTLTPDSLISLMVSTACEQLCLVELRSMTFECDIPPPLAADMDDTLRAVSPLASRWRSAIQGNAATWQARLDTCFTRDANGNGWLNLSAQAPLLYKVSAWGAPTAGAPCSRLWNLASIFYNGRRTVEAKLRRFVAAIERAGTLPYPDAVVAFSEAEDRATPFSVFDGRWLNQMAQVKNRGIFQGVMKGEACRQATRLTVALGRFKAEHDDYPDVLSQLVPDYIDALPEDPFGAPSLTYRREGDSYQLYSIGANGKDDGGWPGTRPLGALSEDGDQLFIYPRRAPAMEPILVPAPGTTQPAAPDTAPAENDARE